MSKILITFFTFYFFAFAIAGKRSKSIRFKELPLSEFSNPESQKLLLRYLLSNPVWDVREDRGKIYAFRRHPSHTNVSTRLGYYSDSSSGTDMRILISFSGPHKPREFSGYTLTENKKGKLTIKTSKSELSSYSHQSYLIVNDSTLSIEIFEASNNPKRLQTLSILEELRAELNNVLLHADELKKNGFIALSGSKQQDSSLTVKEISKGEFLISGSYAFKEEGFIYAKITAFNGENISGKINRMNTKRPVGFSEQGTHLFSFQTIAVNTETVPGRSVMVTIEIVFANIQGLETTILKKEQVLLSAFSRGK